MSDPVNLSPMPADQARQLKQFALDAAAELGFALAGVAPAGLAPHADSFRRWLEEGCHASMDYLARHVEQRCDVREAWPWARSVLCLAASYAPGPGADADGPVARYARGRDYHRALRSRCHTLADALAERHPGLVSRCCVDTAPVLERDLAALAGLGWQGNNCCLIHPRLGSYLLLCEIVLNVDMPPDSPHPGRCGTCTRCIDACPNGALTAAGRLDARRCLSWATIEHRGPLEPDALDPAGRLFGCDICQQVCPYNRDVPPGLAELIAPSPLAALDVAAVLGWSEADWDAATRASAGRRATWGMWLRNACLVAGRERRKDLAADLNRLAGSDDPQVAGAARWALQRLRQTP